MIDVKTFPVKPLVSLDVTVQNRRVLYSVHDAPHTHLVVYAHDVPYTYLYVYISIALYENSIIRVARLLYVFHSYVRSIYYMCMLCRTSVQQASVLQKYIGWK